jgi:hypothetical protein
MCSSSVVWCPVWYGVVHGVVCVVVWHALDFGAYVFVCLCECVFVRFVVWCGVVLCGTSSSMHASVFVMHVCVYVCVCVRWCLYTYARTDRERGSVCELTHQWNLAVAENGLHLKTSTIPRISFLIHSSSSNSSSSSSSSSSS